MEQYILAIRLAPKEKEEWCKWYYHESKYMSIAGVLYLITTLIGITCYVCKIWVKDINSVDPIIYFLTNKFVTKIFVINGYIISTLVVGFGRLFVKKPDVAKNLLVSITSENKLKLDIVSVKTGKTIYSEVTTIDFFLSSVCNNKNKSITMSNTEYVLGIDERKDIYSKADMKKLGFTEIPYHNKVSTITLAKLIEIISRIRNDINK